MSRNEFTSIEKQICRDEAEAAFIGRGYPFSLSGAWEYRVLIESVTFKFHPYHFWWRELTESVKQESQGVEDFLDQAIALIKQADDDTLKCWITHSRRSNLWSIGNFIGT